MNEEESLTPRRYWLLSEDVLLQSQYIGLFRREQSELCDERRGILLDTPTLLVIEREASSSVSILLLVAKRFFLKSLYRLFSKRNSWHPDEYWLLFRKGRFRSRRTSVLWSKSAEINPLLDHWWILPRNWIIIDISSSKRTTWERHSRWRWMFYCSV